MKRSRVFQVLGDRILVAIGITIFSGLFLSGVELAFAASLQILLQKLLQLPSVFLHPKLQGLHLQFTTLCFVIVGIAVFRVITQASIWQAAAYIQSQVTAKMRFLMSYDLLLKKRKNFIPSADVVERSHHWSRNSSEFVYFASSALSNIVLMIAFISYMFWIAPKETLLGFGVLSIGGLFFLGTSSFVRKTSTISDHELKIFTQSLTRITQNWFLVKVLRTSDLEYKSLVKNVSSASLHFLRARYWVHMGWGVPQIFGGFLISLLLYMGTEHWNTQATTLLSFIYIFIRSVQCLSNMAQQLGECSQYYPSVKKAMEYVSEFDTSEIEIAIQPSKKMNFWGRSNQKSTSVSPTSPILYRATFRKAPRVEFKNLSFFYPGGEHALFNNLSLSFGEGTQTGIVGRSGTGKSTLLALILGVIEPSAGEVLIDGKSPTEYFLDPNNRFGYVGPEPFLIAGTLRENLLYGLSKKDFSDERIIEALKSVDMFEWFKKQPEGLEHPILESGIGLSSGQKHRLCLVRALLADPVILILDEASANLDFETEAQVAQLISNLKGSCTVLNVSHRRDMLFYADSILDLNEMKFREPYAAQPFMIPKKVAKI